MLGLAVCSLNVLRFTFRLPPSASHVPLDAHFLVPWIVMVVFVGITGCAPRCDVASPTDQQSNQTHSAIAFHEDTPLGRAAGYLWKKQSDDGGWHSQTYALLRSGQGLTPFVLHTLLAVPESTCRRPPGGVERALQFLRDHTNENGVLGRADSDILEYPNYATAYALQCLLAAGTEADRELAERMRDYLVAEQFCESRGFDPQMPAFGGWGFGGTHPPGKTGHMDLAHTRRVLEALRQAGTAGEVFERSLVFLRFMQKDPADTRPHPVPPETELTGDEMPTFDGGFYFSPVVLAANKGRYDPVRGQWRSYASPTCDGILAQVAAGVAEDDPRLLAARRWLEQHPRLDYPEGVPRAPDEHPDPWGEAIRFNHYAVRGEAYAALDWPGNWREQLTNLLAKDQRSDGSFANPAGPLMKEDDPLVCTTLAAIALVAAGR